MPNRPHTKIKQEIKTTEFKQKKRKKKKDEWEKDDVRFVVKRAGGGRWFKKQIKRKYKGKCYC